MHSAGWYLNFRILFPPLLEHEIQIMFTAKGMENQRYLDIQLDFASAGNLERCDSTSCPQET